MSTRYSQRVKQKKEKKEREGRGEERREGESQRGGVALGIGVEPGRRMSLDSRWI